VRPITSLIGLLAVTTSLASPATVHAALVGVLAGEGTGALIRVYESTGAGSLIADAPTSLSGVAFSASGRLFVTSGSGTSQLLELDPATGAVLSSVPIRVGSDGGGVADIAFQPGSDVLFGVTSNFNPYFGLGAGSGGYLITIDLATGNATVVGRDASLGDEQGGIAFAPDGTLYFTPGRNTIGFLHRLDPATAAILDSVTLSPEIGFMGLAVRPSDGLLFASGPPNLDNNDTIYTIDADTGTVTEVGDAGSILKVHDLAFAGVRTTGAPTLSLVALLACALLIAAAGAFRLRSHASVAPGEA
jgi:DNA-binding beta-propeller fold protein YncE